MSVDTRRSSTCSSRSWFQTRNLHLLGWFSYLWGKLKNGTLHQPLSQCDHKGNPAYIQWTGTFQEFFFSGNLVLDLLSLTIIHFILPFFFKILIQVLIPCSWFSHVLDKILLKYTQVRVKVQNQIDTLFTYRLNSKLVIIHLFYRSGGLKQKNRHLIYNEGKFISDDFYLWQYC